MTLEHPQTLVNCQTFAPTVLLEDCSKQHVVFDLETLGAGADAVIATIGAVRIVHTADGLWTTADTFYEQISLDQPGRQFTGDVVAWWIAQGASPAAREIFEGRTGDLNSITQATQRPSLGVVLQRFADWMGPPERTAGLWCKGPEFDIAILQHAYGGPAKMPWPYCAGRDVRTAEMVTHTKSAKSDHHALHDAQAEAGVVLAFLNRFCP